VGGGLAWEWTKLERLRENQRPQFPDIKKMDGSTRGEGDFIEISSLVQEKPEFVPEILIEKGKLKIHLPLAINWNDLRAVIQSLGCE
jgi:hypothetical protein